MLQVSSEIGRLRRAVVHEPGPEVDRMVPGMMEQLLFDDILYGDRAREEHAQFRRVLQHFGVQVDDASDLLAAALARADARGWALEALREEVPLPYRERLEGVSGSEMARLLVAGIRRDRDEPGVEVENLYGIPPLPNWCFQRDTQIVYGDGVIFSCMAAAARYREALLARITFRFHPDLAEAPVLFDPLRPGPDQPLFPGRRRPDLEGGDVLVLSSDLLVVGASERTNRTGIEALARALARRDPGPRWLVVVEIPRRRAYMHLDTLITLIDRGTCLVYPPVILGDGPECARVAEIDLRSPGLDARPMKGLLPCLARHGWDLEPIPCGGEDHVTQQREQWTDGSNVLAVAPGVITLFDRNLATAEVLRSRGFEIVAAGDLLLGRSDLDPDRAGRACILLESHEISRARGGPHCLVHPLVRDDIGH
jgi:arginine deiminase